ncbi:MULTISPECIES: L-rhamnose isomerase [unclassified Butyrivibrio]|uniref:L-rhamnose isomerase n=1 Tax=unclassified Butyrivibrio TaxID=2639466 RepID=UPI0003F87AA1|nr:MULTISPECIES: L-rhamnose isomerase [unclassified Butyrivibrio]SEL22391.1 L-rhamnose isomerase [Butyrivibrio sp. ob235]
MIVKERYEAAKERYAKLGVDTDKAISELEKISLSMHCWQGDDVVGFDQKGPLSGGIQTTGNYPYKATTPEQLMQDIDEVFTLVPGKHKLNLHACYAVFEGDEWVDRDKLEPKHFKAWVDFAKKHGIGLDFNPTMFSHPMAENATLSSEDETVRKFWVDHCIACLKISEYFATETGVPCMMNIWIPDGFKDVIPDRISPRKRLKDSLDQILATPYDKSKVYVAVESKVFGIGMESVTVGSQEFYLSYAAKNGIMCLIDSGHFHPTENVADKLSSMLLFNEKMALHVTRPVRWDSDHVVIYNDDAKEIAQEIVKNGPDRFFIGMDYFDASINRVSAWTNGMRNFLKALLNAELQPNEKLCALQNERNFTELMSLQERIKMMPVGDVWDYYCEKMGVPTEDEWFDACKKYEDEVLTKRA